MSFRNRTFFILLSVALLLLIVSGSQAATSVAYTKSKIAGVSVNVVTVDLNDSNVRITPALARWGIGTSETFRSMMRRTRPTAAINGTFFCTRSLKPTGDIVIDGQLLWRGYLGTAVTIDEYNQVKFFPTRKHDLYKWCNFSDVLTAGPTLIMRGKTIVTPRIEGFRSSVHFSKRVRSAVGLTYNNKLLFVTTRQHIYLRTLAKVMKRLRCNDAAVLDGGSSTGLYWKGKMVINPRRAMTNCLLVYDDMNDYQQHRSCLYPNRRYTSLSPSGS